MITIVNCETGETIEREPNADELAQMELDRIEAEKFEQAKAEAETKRAEAIAKLETLGLTADDIRAILG